MAEERVAHSTSASVEMTPAARRILMRMCRGETSLTLTQAMDNITRAREAGDCVRRAVEEATAADGKVDWAFVGAILLAKEP